MGRGRKAGGANESFLRKDREEKERSSAVEAQQEGDAARDAAEDKDDAFVSFLGKANSRQDADSESDDDQAFDLAAGGTSSEEGDENSESEEESSSGSGSGDNDDSEDEDDDADETTADLKRLVDDLPSSLRQKVLMGHKINTDGGDSDADSNDDGATEAKLRGITNADAAAALVGNWGKKKHYWAGDTADLEIGQDMQDALDEEEAAQELQEGRLRSMDVQDYGSSSSSDSEEEEMAVPGKKSAAARLGTTVLGKMKAGDVSVQSVDRDVSSLTKKQRLRLLTLDAPELLAVTSDARQKEVVMELGEVIAPLRAFLASEEVKSLYPVSPEDAELVEEDESTTLLVEREHAFVDYLHSKEQLLSSYLTNLLFLMSMHAEGLPTRSHPVMKQLLELQYTLRKVAVLDALFEEDTRLLQDILSKHEEFQESQSKKKSKGKKAGAVSTLVEDFREMREVIASSQRCYLSESAQEEISSHVRSGNNADNDSDGDEDGDADGVDASGSSEDDYESYVRDEEAAMNNIGGSRRRAGAGKESDSEDSDSDSDNNIGDVGETRDKLDFDSAPSAEQRRAKKQALKMSLESFGDAHAKDMAGRRKSGMDDMLPKTGQKADLATHRRARAAYDDDDDEEDAPREKRRKKGADQENGDSYVEGYDPVAMDKLRGVLQGMYGGGDVPTGRQRRPAPGAEDADVDPGSDSDDEGAAALYEDFANKKKSFLKKKSAHYKPEARTSSMFDLEASDVAKGRKNRGKKLSEQTDESAGPIKRAATYEMMKNKGLTPHRKKENRNPRVKKRIAYDKAVVARKGQVREVNTSGVNTANAYSGETTGIKANLSRSRRIST